DPLTERMQRRMERELEDADAALLILNGEQGVGPGDRFIARAIRSAGNPAHVAVNKVDLLDRGQAVRALEQAAGLELPGDVFPVSARTGEGVPELLEATVALMPEGPFLYPPEQRA